MAYWYEGTDNIVAGTAVTMGVGDVLFVKEGVSVGCSVAGTAVQAAAGGDSTILGSVFATSGVAFFASGGSQLMTIGSHASVASNIHAISIIGEFNIINNAGTITAVSGAIRIDNSANNQILNTGTISSTTDPAIRIEGGGNHIVNTGTIGGMFSAIQIIGNTGSTVSTIDNSGIIAGHGTVISAGATLSISNTGTITGGIDFGDGNDVYDGALGVITGVLDAGGGDDTITTGGARDVISGGLGADVLDGNGGRDRFVYANAAESSGGAHDTIFGFDARKDEFDLDIGVGGIDAAISTGTLRIAHFANDVRAALAGHLGANHAILFTANAGDLAAHTVLVVDANGRGGFQVGRDYAIDLSDPGNLNIHLDNFI